MGRSTATTHIGRQGVETEDQPCNSSNNSNNNGSFISITFGIVTPPVGVDVLEGTLCAPTEVEVVVVVVVVFGDG